MTKTTTTIWDPASHLATAEDIAAYLEAALQDGDPQIVAAALGDIARAKGMSQVARDAGLGRESLYKSLSSSGNPELATVLRVISALGLKLHVSATDKVKVPA
jgi:probable addiction module antidote protein